MFTGIRAGIGESGNGSGSARAPEFPQFVTAHTKEP